MRGMSVPYWVFWMAWKAFLNHTVNRCMVLREDDVKVAANECDVLFLALPAGIAGKAVTGEILEKTVVIDLGADFRLHDSQ